MGVFKGHVRQGDILKKQTPIFPEINKTAIGIGGGSKESPLNEWANRSRVFKKYLLTRGDAKGGAKKNLGTR